MGNSSSSKPVSVDSGYSSQSNLKAPSAPPYPYVYSSTLKPQVYSWPSGASSTLPAAVTVRRSVPAANLSQSNTNAKPVTCVYSQHTSSQQYRASAASSTLSVTTTSRPALHSQFAASSRPVSPPYAGHPLVNTSPPTVLKSSFVKQRQHLGNVSRYIYAHAETSDDGNDCNETDVVRVRYHDCRYFYSGIPCPQGNTCTFRHEPKALNKKQVCWHWKNGNCTRKVCWFRHDYLQHEIFHVVWLWEDEKGSMIQYGVKHPTTGRKSSLNSTDIEREYIKLNRAGNLAFTVDVCRYTLDFSQMVQISLQPGWTRRKIERRIRYPRPGRPSGMPASWKSMSMGTEWTTVELDLSSKEFKHIEKAFRLTLPDAQLIHIKRVQNMKVWKSHENYKRTQEQLHGWKFSNLLLFHGTLYQSMEDICSRNFDLQLVGSRFGINKYGKGIYFARDASYSDQYCTVGPTTVLKKIFACKVLVRHMAVGNPQMTKPPFNSSKGQDNDTTTDDVGNPSVFVKYDKDSFYPAYVIEYLRSNN